MHLKKLAVRNFRRLSNVVIDLASDISIFVGANNSGKTSVGHPMAVPRGFPYHVVQQLAEIQQSLIFGIRGPLFVWDSHI